MLHVKEIKQLSKETVYTVDFFYVVSMKEVNEEALKRLRDNFPNIQIEEVKCEESMKRQKICPWIRIRKNEYQLSGLKGIETFIRLDDNNYWIKNNIPVEA